jgi:hypothetical protein
MKLILTLLFAGTIAFASETRVFTGTITDSMCGMDHKHMNISPDDKCVQKCVRMSAQYKYVLYDGKNSYRLSDQETPAKFAAKKVKVTGVLYKKTGIIKVENIEVAK